MAGHICTITGKAVTLVLALIFLSLSAGASDYHYRGSLRLEPATGFLRASWEIDVLKADETKRIFYIRDSLNKPTIGGEDVIDSHIEKVSGFDDFWAINITLGPARNERVRRVEITYDGVLLPEPLPNKINGMSPEVVELSVDSFWFPMDASFSKLLTAQLEIEIEGAWQGVSTGNVATSDGRVSILNEDPRLDIAFVLARAPKLSESENLTIFDLRPEATGIEALISTAKACRFELNGLFGGNNPLPKSKLVITNRKESGYARENYIVLTDIGRYAPDRLTLFLCHEFAHYWARGADFAGVENWLNESLAEYAALLAVRKILGNRTRRAFIDTFKAQIEGQALPPIWQEGQSERGPYLVLYRKGPLALVAFERQYGTKKTTEIIRRFFSQVEKTTPAFLNIVHDVAGGKAEKTIRSLLAS